MNELIKTAFKTRVFPIENQPCKFDRTQHTWHPIVFKSLDGNFSYCIICYLEREKYYDREEKLIKTRYFPFGTWFKLFSQEKKAKDNKEEQTIK